MGILESFPSTKDLGHMYYMELFHSEPEPVWILESDDLQLVADVVPQYYPTYPEPEPEKPAPPPAPKPPPPIVISVPMCCETCEERVSMTLKELPDVEFSCDWTSEKVIVKGKIAPADILMICKKRFKKSTIFSC